MVASFIIVDAIMLMHRYRGYLFGAKTDQEKTVRRNWFKVHSIEWREKQ